MDPRPIGIFDSGIGGLTVAKAVGERLPNERIMYFGDTAHLPYGDKSQTAIQAYSIKICNLLLERNCKAILIACNSASAAAFDLVKEYVGSRALVFNVIDPVVQFVAQEFNGHSIGLIGTKQTVNSGIYSSRLEALGKSGLKSLATPLLAPMIEEGFFNSRISEGIISEYLNHKSLDEIAALILGCTHYPLIKKQIDAYYAGKVEVIDSSLIVADALAKSLEEHGLLNTGKMQGRHHFFVSDYTESFEHSTKLFFGEALNLEYYHLWE